MRRCVRDIAAFGYVLLSMRFRTFRRLCLTAAARHPTLRAFARFQLALAKIDEENAVHANFFFDRCRRLFDPWLLAGGRRCPNDRLAHDFQFLLLRDQRLLRGRRLEYLANLRPNDG